MAEQTERLFDPDTNVGAWERFLSREVVELFRRINPECRYLINHCGPTERAALSTFAAKLRQMCIYCDTYTLIAAKGYAHLRIG